MTTEQLQVALAAYRTRLAEQRTALALLQFGVVLVTVPLTIHTALVLLGQAHMGAARLHVLLPFWGLLGSLFVGGIALTAHAARRLWRVSKECAVLRRSLETELARLGIQR